MSLINDALKKAQKQRASAAAEQSGQAAPPAVAQAAKQQASQSRKRVYILLGVGAVLLIAGSVGTTVIFMQSGQPHYEPRPAPRPAVNAPASSPATTAKPPAVAVAPATAQSTAQTGAAAGTSGPPVAATGVPIAAQPGTESSSPGEAPAATPLPTPAPTAPAGEISLIRSRPAAAASKRNARIQVFVDKLRITGMRLSGEDSKVILNDRLFRLHEIVEPSFGLRLDAADSHTLIFSDAAGNQYVKRL